MRRWWQGILTVLLAGCAALPKDKGLDPVIHPGMLDTSQTGEPYHANLDEMGTAPELTNEVWLNTETPMRLAGLRGKVVLLDMWTFG